ncbi:MAG: hypothetical protein MRZ77_05310 [Clostridiales bacterium]|nr:hypothetical protein [Clostridiales bacterium]
MMALRITIVDAAKIRTEVMEKYGVKVHIHDTCGSFYMNIDEENREVSDYVVNAFSQLGQDVEVSDDGKYFSFR